MLDTSRRGFLGAAAVGAAALGGLPTPVQADDANRLPGKTPHTKFAVNIEMWFTKLPFLERLDATAKLGFPAVEFWPWKGGGKDVEQIADRCKQLGIEIAQFTAWGFKPGLNDPANHDLFETTVAEACDVADRLRCKKMTIVAGDDVPGMTQEQMHENVIAGIERVKGLVEKRKVMLILEPMNIRVDHKGHCLYGSPAAVHICRTVDSPMVKINWDLYHMQISEGDLCGRLKEGFDQCGYLQLADHPGRHEPGTGEVHYNRVLKQAQQLGYSGYVGLECRPLEGELKAAQRVAAADVW